MERKRVGKFYATAFDETIYTFIVYEDGIACPTMKVENAKRLIIKPKFEMVGHQDDWYLMPVRAEKSAELIKTYDIDEELFKYLKAKKMIFYSTDMAHLYGFEDKNGYDSEFNKTPFKRVKDKTKILTKQKQGIFN